MATRTYPDGSIIPASLPAAYKRANNKSQYCGNCVYFLGNYCTRWEARVKAGYVCAAWQPKQAMSVAPSVVPEVDVAPPPAPAPTAAPTPPTPAPAQPRQAPARRTSRRSYGY